MLRIKDFIKDESGAGVVELILIIVVLVGLVVIFKDQITDLVEELFQRIVDEAGRV